MKDTLTAECFLEALSNYIEAKSEHDKARQEYMDGGGYSWGCYGRPYVERMQEAANQFQKWFSDLVEVTNKAKL